MTRLQTIFLSVVSLAIAVALPVTGASAQQSIKDQLVGAWSLVSLVVDPDGKRILPFGPTPIGRMTFGPDGRFSTIIVRPELPAFASNNRMQGTPEEYKAIVNGSSAFFGTYAVDEAGKAIVFRIEFSTFPNWNGDEQKRTFTLEGDELRYINPTVQIGPGSSAVVWKRMN